MNKKKNELRIGNLVYHKDKIIEIKSLPSKQSIYGIKLTEDFLLRFGFDKYNKLITKEFMLEYFEGKIIIKSYTSDDNEGSIFTNVDQVHQLQNLYFALTGEEL